jgi:large subunit ribosomal protein L31
MIRPLVPEPAHRLFLNNASTSSGAARYAGTDMGVLYFFTSLRYNRLDMKSSIHPTNYRPVVFSDDQAGFAFLTQSTAQTDDEIKWEDGNTYPLVKVHISSASHPFFTGEEKIIDTEGRVDRFKAKFAAAEARKAELANKAKKKSAQAAKKSSSEK